MFYGQFQAFLAWTYGRYIGFVVVMYFNVDLRLYKLLGSYKSGIIVSWLCETISEHLNISIKMICATLFYI